ncbi:cytochrome P450 4V2-like, partial [Temnothorax curvispinosus]|uniref:Cytochrome P450 4V2-like n=1 Tax=Temnothorax curvispinosus TaxID=300111 RepID=A0A6J1PXS8_9HYME
FLDVILKVTEDYSSPFQFWFGSKLLIGIYEPDDVKTILQSKNCIDKSILYKVIPLLGMGLVTAPESIWTRMRKLTAPTFSSMMLQNFFNIFVEQSAIFTHQLEKDDLSGNEIILQEQISHCAWRIAC